MAESTRKRIKQFENEVETMKRIDKFHVNTLNWMITSRKSYILKLKEEIKVIKKEIKQKEVKNGKK